MRHNSTTPSLSVALPALLLAFAATVQAGPRTSSSYTVRAEAADAGGQRVSSAAYTNDGSVGGIVGISTVAAPAETAKAGYIGQLYEVAGLQITAASTTVDEGGTRQLGAAQLLDDNTTIALAAGSITWSVQSGPLATDANGLASAGNVYQDTAAVAQGDYAGQSGTLDLTVLDSLPDNYGSYAGDTLDDAWQVQYFGVGNPDAAPGIDADGDGQDNAFEFTAGLVPTDRASFFDQRIEAVPGQPGQTRVIFSPRLNNRSYTVQTSTTLLVPSWITLTGTTETDDGDERTVTDPGASGERKFYKVEIAKP